MTKFTDMFGTATAVSGGSGNNGASSTELTALKTELDTKIKALENNEVADDLTVAALKAIVDAIPASPDLTPLTEALSSATQRITSLERLDWIKPIYTAPGPIKVTALDGATLTTDVGTLMVNEAKVHTLARITGAVMRDSWQTTLTIPQAFGSCEVRFAVHSSAVGSTIRVKVGTQNDYLAGKDGDAWSVYIGSMTRYVDGEWTWFRVPVDATVGDVDVRIGVPIGLGQVPCVYVSGTPTEVSALVLSGMELRSEDGKSMVYRPTSVDLSAYAKTADIYNASWLLNTNWQIAGAGTDDKYTRILRDSQTALTKIEFEYDQAAPKPYVINAPFTAGASVSVGFAFHSYWNTDPSGTTRMITIGSDRIVIALNNDNRIVTLAVQNTSKSSTDPDYYKKIRNVKLNGIPCDLNI